MSTTTVERLPRHQVSTRYLRVPRVDWPKVRQGIKTEFRTRPRETAALTRANLPTLVIAYTSGAARTRRSGSALMMLTERRYEPLFYLAQDAEGLEREDFPSYAHFRRYWLQRQGRGRYRPADMVFVWRLRPVEPDDLPAMGDTLLRELYGEYL